MVRYSAAICPARICTISHRVRLVPQSTRGSGWEVAVLPLLREQEGSGTSTAEERVIGAGLQALERKEDGSAVKELFFMFAVTQVSLAHGMRAYIIS